jgi:ribosomal protein L37AE/L43A
MDETNQRPTTPEAVLMTIEYDHATMNLLISMRDGTPGTCDFCKQPFTPSRYPVPEEGGAWACRECETRWAKEDK